MNPDSAEDRLSSLPKNIIESILICLPLRDAVRTSILAHAWRYEWSNVSQLVFDKKNFPLYENQLQIDYDMELSKIIDQALLLHQGPIHKFKLSTELECCTDIDKWILFVSRSGIREFILDKWKGRLYKVPSSLFLCEEITYLELYKCILAPPASFNGFNNLRRLDLQGVDFSNDGLDNLISNCPLLNKLVLRNIVGCTHLKINSPKLVDLSVTGAFKDLTFDKTPALAKVSIEWSNEGSQSVENGALCKLAILLGSLPSINRLELLVPTFQILSAGDVPVSLPDSCQLSELSVSINFEDMQEVLAILCIFRSSPLLKWVDITSISDKSTARICIEDFFEAHDDFNCLFSVLQFINVTAYTGTITELKFMEFVLANAPVLETVKIQLKKNIADVLKIYRQLIRIRRISPKVEILILNKPFFQGPVRKSIIECVSLFRLCAEGEVSNYCPVKVCKLSFN